MAEPPQDVVPLESLTLSLTWDDATFFEIESELLQVLAGAGLVVRIVDETGIDTSALPYSSEKASQPRAAWEEARPAQSEQEEEARPTQSEQEPDKGRMAGPAGSSAISWPLEKLQAEWETLLAPERIRVARYGNRGARGVVLRSNDRALHVHLLSNAHITAEEVASLAGNAALDPSALRRIASNTDWLRSAEVTRNLVCNPKMPMPEVERLLRTLPRDELVRLSKSGRARSIVKQAVAKRLKSSKT